MGSLKRSLIKDKTYRILLASFAMILLVGLLSPPAWATNDAGKRKLRRLETLGLDVQDPTIVQAADNAHALHSVNVFPKADDINVVLQLSGLPSYNSYRFDDNRLVVDLYNTIDITPSAEFALAADDPIRMVRNAQYRVQPSIISRVVLELNNNVTPEITTEGTNLVISTPLGDFETVSAMTPEEADLTEVEIEIAEDTTQQVADVPEETIIVPAVDVETGGPAVDVTLAKATPDPMETEWADAPKEVEEVSVETEAAETIEDIETVAFIETVEIAETVEEVEEVEMVEEPEMTEAVEIVEPEEVIEMAEETEPVQVAEVVEEEAIPEIEFVTEKEAVPAQAEEVVQAAENVDADEAAAALNGMFSEMQEVEEIQMAEDTEIVESAEFSPDEAAAFYEEMLSKMKEAEDTEKASEGEGEAPEEAVTDEIACEDLITLVFRDAELEAVLDIVARKGNLNIIAGKNIKGKVTVRLVDVPLDVALNAILNVNGYGYIKTDNIVRILPLSEIGEVINMDTETYNLSYAKAEEAKKTLERFLTPSGGIEVDARTNMLVVTDVPGNIERLEKLIYQIDRRVQQVLIEVIILDSVLADDADLGISWDLLNTDTSLGPDVIDVNLPVGANALNVAFGVIMGDLNLTAFIDAVVTDSDSRVLANPKVLTLNNEAAAIEIIQEFPYNDVTQTSQGGQLSNITFKEIGTKLEVKPQITHDGHVILWVAPEQNSIVELTPTGVPVVDTRKAETTLIVKNHQTIVMGGLRENRNINSITKVPFLGDVPGVRYAFRNVQSDKTDSELLVFITVHIVESPILLTEEKIKAEELANLPRHPNSTIELIRP